jgi:hypothetical protein
VTIKTRIRKVASRLPWPRSRSKNWLGLHRTLYCSFCGKSQHDVAKLIAGPSVFICNECVGLCTDILLADSTTPESQKEALAAGSKDAAESKDAPAAESHRIEDIRSMPTERLLHWLKIQEALFEQARAGMQDAVDTLRKREVSWATIGEALGVSRQGAWDRFS